MSQITIRKYRPADEAVWDDFVRQSKNGAFLFERGFMDYHAHRFKDHSVLIFQNDKLKSVMSCNEEVGSVVSHGGLSYGGLLLDKEVNLSDVISFFYHLLKYFHERGFTKLTYKCVPPYLPLVPSFEDQYALFLANAVLTRRDMCAVYSRNNAQSFRESRMQSARKAGGSGIKVVRASDPSRFWPVLESNLMDRHGVKPVHTLDEIRRLMSRFPDRIHCFEAVGEQILGGTIIFEMATTAHAQYISSTADGKSSGALDFLFQTLITDTFAFKPYFSFGMSNEKEGRYLNLGLNSWKEGFGTSPFPLDFYQVQTSNYTLLGDYE